MIGPRGLDLIRRFESLRLDAYDDGVGVWTIGFGHTAGVQHGQRIDEATANILLALDVEESESAVDRLVTRTLNEAQRDALVSFTFNLGAGALAKSELLTHVNAGHHATACRAFLGWTMAGGRPMRGILRRRLAEAALYCEDAWTDHPASDKPRSV